MEASIGAIERYAAQKRAVEEELDLRFPNAKLGAATRALATLDATGNNFWGLTLDEVMRTPGAVAAIADLAAATEGGGPAFHADSTGNQVHTQFAFLPFIPPAMGFIGGLFGKKQAPPPPPPPEKKTEWLPLAFIGGAVLVVVILIFSLRK